MNYAIAVRELCEFTAKQGDLDFRFTPSPSAQEGIAGHAVVAARRRGDLYQSEVALTAEYRQLLVRGRADGYDAAQNRLEEIKTYRGDLAAMPDNHRQLHWAQAKMYGWMLCDKLDLTEIQVALVYFDIGSQRESVFTEVYAANTLRLYFEQQCERFLAWAEQELAHRAARDRALTAMRFPHPSFRDGQRQLAEAVYKSAVKGSCLMVQAPTGIGKTIGTVFPMLKACPGQALDKLFFLPAKSSGRALALEAVSLIRNSQPGLPLRVIELVAREKACEHPDNACHGESCPLAKGFYDRLPQARAAAVLRGTLDKSVLREVALQHQVCPYYLSQDMVRWSDVVIGDYNYYFDLNAMLFSWTAANQWRVGVLVDEAHNLIERARKMYSAELHQGVLKNLRRAAPVAIKSTLDRLHRRWVALLNEMDAPYQVCSGLPGKFLDSLQQTITTLTEYFAENPATADADLQNFYFDALHFAHLAELFSDHSLFDVTQPEQPPGTRQPRAGSVLCIRNVVPAPFLAQRFAATHCAVLFSATLSPAQFYANTLGLPEQTPWINVDSPFRADQLAVHIATHVSTRYQDRTTSLPAIVALIGGQYSRQPGNYLAFVSSFDYLEKLTALFAEHYPAVPVWVQTRRMDETERERFLGKFTENGQGIGFAVLGGAFSEGIDLPGARLIGAFIATLGLPQYNPVNEEIRKRMQHSFGAGYNYTYLFPGMQKVVQAAGRVIRTQQDQGVVYLIDDRFAQKEVRRLLPQWWKV